MSDIAPIDYAAATPGTMMVHWSAAGGGSGVNVSPSRVTYPAEFAAAEWAHAGQHVEWDVIKITAAGVFWDNDLAVSASGVVSADANDPLVRPHSDYPTVPVNRFLDLGFAKSGNSEGMSVGSLSIDILPWGSEDPEGTALVPSVALLVKGHFDPVGVGDATFSFKLTINTHGYIGLSDVEISKFYGTHIYQDGNSVLVQMAQLTSW